MKRIKKLYETSQKVKKTVGPVNKANSSKLFSRQIMRNTTSKL